MTRSRWPQRPRRAQAKHFDVVIVDTAGRLGIDDELMAQAAAIRDAVDPDEVLFVVDAMIGQDAVDHRARPSATGVGFTGVVLTKLDGDARGGAALSVRRGHRRADPVRRPHGEKLDDFDVFHPDRMASRILGMGDVLTLIEQAEQVFDAEQAEAAAAKIGSGELTLEDFLEQMLAIRKMGPIGNLLGMLPGAGQMKDALAAVDDSQLDRVQAIIRGMTPAERADPKIINASRRLRIANGSGVTVSEVNQLVDRFFEARKMMSQMAGQMGMPFGRKGSSRKTAKNKKKGQEGRKKVSGPDATEGAQPLAGAGMPEGFPDLSNMPKGLDELPPGLADIDLSKLKFRGTTDLATSTTLHIRGRALPDEEPVEWWVVDGVFERRTGGGSPRPSSMVAGSSRAWSTRIVTSASATMAASTSMSASRRPRPNAASVRSCCRDAGSPTDTRSLDDHHDLPRIIRAGPAPAARPKRYQPAAARSNWKTSRNSPTRVAEQARWGDGWVKLVGDWIDRDTGDLAPLWSDDVLKAAMAAAHANGARVTAHVLQRGCAAGSDQRGHRLHRAWHRPHRRHRRPDGRARHRVGADADQHRELPRHRRRGREVSGLCQAPAGPLPPVPSAHLRRARSRRAGSTQARTRAAGSRTAASPTRSTR
mgnify:CR=1 FL=1